VLADAISESVGEHPVDPTLEDGRHGEPPQRELEDQGIGPQELLDLGSDILGQCVGLESLLGGRGRLEPCVRREQREVGTVDLGFPAVAIEV
jgi:hypothetical protein